MNSFRGAVEVGTHAIETDIHLTKDGVVVLSHVGSMSLETAVSLNCVRIWI
jgi:glycerophosphoryl diester phosphodiesterase